MRACACVRVRACARAWVCACARVDYWLAFPSCKSLAKIIEKKNEKKLAMRDQLSFTGGDEYKHTHKQ